MAGSSVQIRTTQRAIVRAAFAALVALVALACGPVGVAMAELPIPTIESPISGGVSNDRTPSFSGASNDSMDDVTLSIYAGTSVEPGALVQSLTTLLPPLDGAWSVGPSDALADGVYTAQATQTNSLSETGASEPPVTFTVDTAAPAVALNPLVSPSNDTMPSFTGSASDTTQVAVEIYEGATVTGSPISSATATGTGGGWTSDNASPALPSGKHTYTAIATQESSLGNPAGVSSPVTFTVDTTSPTVSLNQPVLLSNNTSPSFTGTASDSTQVTVQIYAGGTATGSIVATATATGPGGGDWISGNASPALADGLYTAIAVQESSLGNPSGVSTPVTFTVDTTSPTVSLNQPASPSNDTMPSFTGSASDTTQVTVEIYKGAMATGPVVSTAMAAGTGGAWTSGNASPALPDGQYTAIATQTSSLGNPEGISNSVTFTVDTAAPAVSLNQPKSPSDDTTPFFTGSASENTPITVQIYAGATTTGPVISTATAAGTGGDWTSDDADPTLSDGQYTAIATQESLLGNHSGKATSVSFTVDTVPPHITLTYPADGGVTSSESQMVKGSAGVSAGDLPGVTVQLFSGSTIVNGQVPLQSIMVNATGGAWSVALGGLNVGTYTVRAEQSDEAGNIGRSEPVTFSVLAPASPTPAAPPVTPVPFTGPTPGAAPTPPAAAFTWVPSNPTTGQSVVLASTSTDADSAITAFAWDLTGSGAPAAGGPVISTSFSTPGNHVVHLRVTDGDGLTSVVTETIPVAATPLVLMQPFPVVRIAGSESASGARISLLTVQAPVGTQVEITCWGHHCPSRSQSRVVAASRGGSKAGTVVLTFGRFERSLQAGVVLEIRVSKPGEIGKYTSFAIRRGRLPVRVDACIEPADPKPIPCPAS
jgi:hypothetical protein